MDSVLNLYKKKSETPLQTIERYVSSHPEFKGVKMTYAGRLDPMAEGVLVVLTGEKNKDRQTYTGLDKEYEFEFVLGIETDTLDTLGKITNTCGSGTGLDEKTTEEKIRTFFDTHTGKIEQVYPIYSSKVVDGTPLFELARTGKLSGVKIPVHEVEVFSLTLTGTSMVSREDFKKRIFDSVSSVKGDFRQKETLELWEKYFKTAAPATSILYQAKVSCGSGFYVRQLVSDLGTYLGTGAITTSILRTRVGEYVLADAL